MAVEPTETEPLAAPAPARRCRPPAPEWEPAAVYVLAAAAAVVAAIAPVDPTGIAGVDVVLKAGLAAVVVLFAWRARSWALVVAGAAVALAAGRLPWLVVGLLALGLGVYAVTSHRASGLERALVGAAVTVVLLRMPPDHPIGVSTVTFLTAVVPLVVSGWRGCSTSTRRRSAQAGIALGAATALLAALFGVSLLQSRSAINQALTQTQAALDAARALNAAEAVRQLEAAANSFTRAGGVLSREGLTVTEVLPGVRRHVVAIRAMSAESRDVTANAIGVLQAGGEDAFSFSGGAIDVARLTALERPLAGLVVALQRAQTAVAELPEGWLVPPVANALDTFRNKVDDALGGAEIAVDITRVAPQMLGADSPRRYLIVFVTPTEARGRTGLIGNYGELTVEEGRLRVTTFGRRGDLDPGAKAIRSRTAPTLTGPPDYLSRYARFSPEEFLASTTMSPDFPSVAQVLEGLYPQVGGAPIDGVISVDPKALAALVGLTGPVYVSALDRLVPPEEAERFLLRDQYIDFPVVPDRVDALEDVARQVTDRVNQLTVAGPAQLQYFFGPSVAGGHLVAHSTDPAVQRLFDRIGISGALPPVQGDFLGVVTNNAAGNKIDLFLRREIDYRVRFDPDTGATTATVDVTMHNDAPSEGLPPYLIGNSVVPGPGIAPLPQGFNRTYLSVYSPLELQSSQLDGQPVDMQPETELGRHVYSRFLDIPPGGTRTLRLELAGAIEGSGDYRLDVAAQPMPIPDRLRLEVDGREITAATVVDRDMTLVSGAGG